MSISEGILRTAGSWLLRRLRTTASVWTSLAQKIGSELSVRWTRHLEFEGANRRKGKALATQKVCFEMGRQEVRDARTSCRLPGTASC